MPGLQASSQVFIGRSVADLLRKWDAPEQRAPVQRPRGVKAGDDAKREYFPHELKGDYVPLKVVGVGSSGIVVLANFVKKGHVKYQVAILEETGRRRDPRSCCQEVRRTAPEIGQRPSAGSRIGGARSKREGTQVILDDRRL